MGFSHREFASIIEVGVVCNNASIVADTVVGQPTEGALVVLAQRPVWTAAVNTTSGFVKFRSRRSPSGCPCSVIRMVSWYSS